MEINSLNHDKITYNTKRTEEQLSIKDYVTQFYALVRQQMPAEGDFDDIQMYCAKDDKGEYYLNVNTFLNNRTNLNVNCLNVYYVPNNKDFKMSMNLIKGTKTEILDFLGNESNLDKIESYMSSLRKKTDLK